MSYDTDQNLTGNFRSPLVIVFQAGGELLEFSRISYSLLVDWKKNQTQHQSKFSSVFAWDFFLMYWSILFFIIKHIVASTKTEENIFSISILWNLQLSCSSVISTINNILSPVPSDKTPCFLSKIIKQVGRRLWSIYLVTVA